MGCDIHLKLEKRLVGKSYYERDVFDGDVVKQEVVELTHDSYEREWHSVEITSNGCWSDRVYGMFAKLADVRNHFERKLEPIEQRGFPEDACPDTKKAYTYIVISDEEYEADKSYYQESHGDLSYINESEANEWIADGWSEEIKPWVKGTRRLITGPDWHSPNWCTTEELEECIKDVFWNEKEQKWVGDYIEWLGLLGAMKGIEYSGQYECRAVFWFDN